MIRNMFKGLLKTCGYIAVDLGVPILSTFSILNTARRWGEGTKLFNGAARRTTT